MTHVSTALNVAEAPVTAGIEIRLAASAAEVRAAQRLRYRVFYQEMGARPSAHAARTGHDQDLLDDVCDHLLALAGGEVVGTYRLIRRAAAARVGGFYSAREFDITPLANHRGEILELGRSCVDAAWRSRGAVQALWQGLATYVAEHRIDYLFGCASLPGTDVQRLAAPLAYLHENFLAPEDLRCRALPEHRVGVPASLAAFDERAAFRALPPLVKGYLWAGAWIGDGAVVDRPFNTTDVLVTLDANALTTRYRRRYEARAQSCPTNPHGEFGG